MESLIQPLPFDAAKLNSLSERIVTSHHKNNYGGAVKRLGAIREKLAALDVATAPGFLLNGLKREELIAANSMRLHEVHFDSLGGNGALDDGPLKTTLAAAFGSFDRWRAEFVALGKALGGGSGWVLLSWSPREAKLVNQWAADHAHALADATPLLALDMYEHAYHMDFGASAGEWVETFMRNIAWTRVAEKFELAAAASAAAIEVAPRDLASKSATLAFIDVRRAPIVATATTRIPGGVWRNPEMVDTWVQELKPNQPVAVYCVHGHAISRSVAARLRAAGIDARCVAGGIERWSHEQMPLEANPGMADRAPLS
jgi:superoxide dismutase, Fe-Mn family